MAGIPIRRLWCAVPFLLAACATAPTPGTQPEAFAPAAEARRVVFISFDGLGADSLAQQSGLRGFEWLQGAGATARVITVNPTQTSPAHTTLLTGAEPEKHGIVANRFHLAGTPLDQTAVGFDTPIDVETLVEAARRQNRRVGSIAFPTVDAKTPRRTADFGLNWSTPHTRPQTITLPRDTFKSEWLPPGWTPPATAKASFSPVRKAHLDCGSGFTPRVDVQVVAYDTTDDQAENYDALRVEADGKELAVDARGWFPLTRRIDGELHGSWSRLIAFDSALQRVSVYCGSVAKTSAYPDAFRALVEEEAGFWPGPPDPGAGADTYRDQLERFATFFTRAQTAAIEKVDFDLLLAYQPQIDQSSHHFMITATSQKSFTPEASAAGAAVRRSAFEQADRAVLAIASALDFRQDALVVVGDHGLVPVDTELRVNRLLTDSGLAARWRAFASGNVAHIYPIGGSGDDPAKVVAALRASGYFELVRTKTSASHANSGDIVATSHPNVILNASNEAPAVGVPRENGSHGALNTHRELHTVFFAVGAGVQPRRFEAVSQTRIARYVARLLGIDAPAGAE